jgi:hypothetical protein
MNNILNKIRNQFCADEVQPHRKKEKEKPIKT